MGFYTLTNTGKYTGFKMAGYWNSTWSNVEYNSSINSTYNGYVCHSTDSGLTHFTNLLFDTTTLASLRTKTVTKIQFYLYFSVTDNTDIRLRFKSNSTASDFTTPGSDILTTTASSSKNWTLTSYGVPQYGYVVGPYDTNSTSNDWVRVSSATLEVTTQDYSYTLNYNANGGSGAPSQQKTTDDSADSSKNFTVSSTVPTRSGYEFLNWNTQSDGTGTSYSGGNSISISRNGTITLYAIWRPMAMVHIVNSAGTGFDLYLVYMVNNAGTGLEMYRVMVVNSSGNALEPYY